MKKAVIYARYSSDRQREESIEGQIRVCEEYAKKHDLSIIHIYTDRALTGRTDKRPQFQMMIKDAGKMNFEIVLVYKLNRFARNRYDSARYKQIKNADKYKRILLTSLIRNVIVYDEYIEVQYNYKDELPILRNTVKIKSSSQNLLAEQVGFEPTEPYGSTDFESAPL